MVLHFIKYLSTLGPTLQGYSTRLNKAQKSQTWVIPLRLSRLVKFESLWIQVASQVFAIGPSTMPFFFLMNLTIAYGELKTLFLYFFFLLIACLNVHLHFKLTPFYSAPWRLFKSIFYALILLRTWATVLSETLVAGPFLISSYFTFLGTNSWKFIYWLSTCGSSFLGQTKSFWGQCFLSSFQGLKMDTPKALRP